ncbi:MAG TPA: hypothetical protein VMA31_00980 [Bryobacteraceae bacterium]|nr:hypothetical protein [Bryobacteraceae bacterium]
MRTRLLAMLLFAGATMFAGPRVAVGFGVPAPVVTYAPPPPAAVAYVPPMPGPGYSWVAGYYYPVGPRWAWRPGNWARAPYARAYWVAPHYYGHRYYSGYWRR